MIYISNYDLVYSQSSGSPGVRLSDYISVDTLINKFEKKNSLRIFYIPDLFQNKNLHRSVTYLPLDEFISRLKSISKCSVYYIDSVTIALVKSDVMVKPIPETDKSQILYIGQLQENDKYPVAKVEGKTLDGKTGNPLPGVSIYFDQLKKGIVSDSKGKFSIDLSVDREFDMKYNYMGYEEASRKIKVLSNGTLNLELFEKTVKLNEVVILAERADQNVNRTQMSLLKLDAKAIKELPLTLGEIDIIKSVSLLPGIQSSGEFGTGFYVRGGSSDQNLILIEDVPIFNSSHLFGLTGILNPDGVASVTLLKAGIPAKYGERVSSIMDIRMGSSNQDNAKVKGGIGLINSRINVDLPLANNKINLYLGGRATYSDWLLKKMPDADLKTSSAKFYDLNALLSFTLNTHNKINLFGYYSSDEFGFSRHTNYNYGNLLSSLRWNHIFNKNLSSVLTVGISSYKYNISEFDTLRKSEAYKSESSVLYNDLKYNINWTPIQNNSFDMGFNAIRYSISPGKLSPYNGESFIKPVTMQKEQAYEYAVYLSDDITFSEKLSSEIGLRYSGYVNTGPGTVYVYNDAYTRSAETIMDTLYYGKNKVIKRYDALEPRFSLRYSISDKSSVKLSYTKNKQYLNLISNTSVENPADYWKLSNSYIKPLSSEQYAMGYFRNFKNNTFETSVEVYYKKLQNCIEYKNGATIYYNPTLEADLLNAGGYSYGLELYIKKSLGRLTGWLSYSYSSSKRRTTSDNAYEKINNNQYFPSTFDKPHNFNVVGNYHISKRWRFSWAFTYNTERPITLPELKYDYKGKKLIYYSDRNKYRLPDYHRLDISITLDESLKLKKFWKGSWTFSIINLYGRKNVYSVFYQKNPDEVNIYKVYSMYKLYIIGRPLPTLTYNFTF